MRISDWSSDVCSSDLALIEDAATLGDLGRMRAMLAVTRRAIAADPADPRAYYLQAVLAARAGRFDLARVLLQKRSEEHTSELQSLMRTSYAVFCLKTTKQALDQTERNYEHNNMLHRP